MPLQRFSPFKNDADRKQIGDLIIENRLDRISMHGSLDITMDKEGLEFAREHMKVLNLTILTMVHTDLPDRIAAVDAKS